MQTKISKLAMMTMPCMIALSLVACGGSSHHGNNGGNSEEGTTGNTVEWVTESGIDTSLIRILPEMKDTCIVKDGTIAISGDVWEQYGAWIWNPNNNNANLWDNAEWPGEDFTDNVIDGCSLSIRNVIPPEAAELNSATITGNSVKYKSIDGYNIIINNFNNGQQTADIEGLSSSNNCVTLMQLKNGTVVGELGPARECGINIEGREVSDSDFVTEI